MNAQFVSLLRTSQAHSSATFLLLIIKLLLCNPWRHMGQCSLSSNHSQSHYQMKVRSRLHAPAALPQQPLDRRPGWPHKRYKRTGSSERSLAPTGKRRTPRASSPQSNHYTNRAIPAAWLLNVGSYKVGRWGLLEGHNAHIKFLQIKVQTLKCEDSQHDDVTFPAFSPSRKKSWIKEMGIQGD
jgi:hypothetical protein